MVLSLPNLMLVSMISLNTLRWVYISYISEKYVRQSSLTDFVCWESLASSPSFFFLLVSDKPDSNLNSFTTTFSFYLPFSTNYCTGVSFLYFFFLFSYSSSSSSLSWLEISALNKFTLLNKIKNSTIESNRPFQGYWVFGRSLESRWKSNSHTLV